MPQKHDPTNAWTGALARMGLLDPAEAEGRSEFLWPECRTAWRCWQGVQTQWRVGMGGATGLDYTGVRAYLDEQDLAPDERREVFGCIQAAERETLEVWDEQRKRKAAEPLSPAR